MFGLSHLELLQKILDFDINFLRPWNKDTLKPSKMYRACFAAPVVMMLITLSLLYFEWDTLPFTTVAENIAIAIVMVRSLGYGILVKKFFTEYEQQVLQMLEDRKSLPCEPLELSLTERYCKIEVRLAIGFRLNIYFLTFVVIHVLDYFIPNAYQLPFNCYMVFLPIDGLLFAWELNYLVLTVSGSLVALFIISFLPMLYIMMDQSCWLLDMALITAQNLNEHLQLDEDIRDPERVAKTDGTMKKIVERCQKFVEWQSEVQDLLSWYFNLEFQVQSLILCFSIYVMSLTFKGGMILIVFMFCAIQLSILCWMGTRVTTRIDQLSFEISKNWYLMTPSQRKSLQMILHWTQNMKSFSGIFSDVSLETCKAIFEASYSLYTFLKSTNE